MTAASGLSRSSRCSKLWGIHTLYSCLLLLQHEAQASPRRKLEDSWAEGGVVLGTSIAKLKAKIVDVMAISMELRYSKNQNGLLGVLTWA